MREDAAEGEARSRMLPPQIQPLQALKLACFCSATLAWFYSALDTDDHSANLLWTFLLEM